MSTETTASEPLKRKDFVTDNDVRWCPGCGDYAILNALQRTLPELGVPRENFVVVSGIGCSSRFPYYMNTYGFHTIHGRAPTVATGVKVANPDLSVWVVTGDGDGLSIGGNHLMHLLRRNVNVNVLLFNNRIYGLTKGQYSPTSPIGTRTKTTPMGSVDPPIDPVLFALGAKASFIARTIDNNPKHMAQVFKAAHEHKGVSFVEILQNCVIFNDKTWDGIYSKETRNDHLLFLEKGKPLLFGKDKEKGVVLHGVHPRAVPVGENGCPLEDVIVHQPDHESALFVRMLAVMGGPNLPVPVGVIRERELPTYEDGVDEQIAAAQEAEGTGSMAELLDGGGSWVVE
jgi:2-oxoglutarate ferredoxin oxidoreductase subunit beta